MFSEFFFCLHPYKIQLEGFMHVIYTRSFHSLESSYLYLHMKQTYQHKTFLTFRSFLFLPISYFNVFSEYAYCTWMACSRDIMENLHWFTILQGQRLKKNLENIKGMSFSQLETFFFIKYEPYKDVTKYKLPRAIGLCLKAIAVRTKI